MLGKNDGKEAKKKGTTEGLQSLLGKSDWIPFRNPKMNWFVKTDSSLQFDSIQSREVIERLWPKGAEMLF